VLGRCRFEPFGHQLSEMRRLFDAQALCVSQGRMISWFMPAYYGIRRHDGKIRNVP
jgi:hypothetical protein